MRGPRLGVLELAVGGFPQTPKSPTSIHPSTLDPKSLVPKSLNTKSLSMNFKTSLHPKPFELEVPLAYYRGLNDYNSSVFRGGGGVIVS